MSGFALSALFFRKTARIVANDPAGAFDYNGNGRIDFAGIVTLFDTMSSRAARTSAG